MNSKNQDSKSVLKVALSRMWNKEDDKIIIPKTIGFGVTINFYAFFVKLNFIKKNV